MASLYSKSLQIIQMLDPLQLAHTEAQDREIEFREKQGLEPSTTRNMEGLSVRCWSVNDVLMWLRQDVHMPLERMEELSSTFENEEIDGSKLLSLERSSYACSNMTDTEWLLLHAARESLVNHERTVEMLSENQSPSTSKSSEKELQENDFNSNVTRLQGSLIPTSAQSPGSLLSYLRFLSLPRNLWSSSASKQEQKEPATAEVYLLQEEVLTAQEREASLKARMDHLDQVLRTSQLASYLYTRFRWTPLPGELPVDDDAEVDDWLQRFLVLGGSTLFFYPQAADFRPQGAIIMREVVDMGYISGQFLHEQENVKWFGFQVQHLRAFVWNVQPL